LANIATAMITVEIKYCLLILMFHAYIKHQTAVYRVLMLIISDIPYHVDSEER